MVKIVYRDRDGKRQYGIVDALNKVMFYWTDWTWSKKEATKKYWRKVREKLPRNIK